VLNATESDSGAVKAKKLVAWLSISCSLVYPNNLANAVLQSNMRPANKAMCCILGCKVNTLNTCVGETGLTIKRRDV